MFKFMTICQIMYFLGLTFKRLYYMKDSVPEAASLVGRAANSGHDVCRHIVGSVGTSMLISSFINFLAEVCYNLAKSLITKLLYGLTTLKRKLIYDLLELLQMSKLYLDRILAIYNTIYKI